MLDSANTPHIMSVSELNRLARDVLEQSFPLFWVSGEISNFTRAASGHWYFSLKDESAKIDAVIWKGVFGRLRHKPEEGLEVVVTGKITSYPLKSSYQIVIDGLEPAGVGALLAQLDERHARLVHDLDAAGLAALAPAGETTSRSDRAAGESHDVARSEYDWHDDCAEPRTRGEARGHAHGDGLRCLVSGLHRLPPDVAEHRRLLDGDRALPVRHAALLHRGGLPEGSATAESRGLL